ncbi:uncharacterized protein [Aegilops tauschii subsp. strangulata]|uniref:uncharacterized protein n=1 Tax=Aegilops tauschii subsp. strangulata TaxID=200361 RepID=UPI001ABBF93A|nr:uncharacterized protein LOC120964852 [Aegilops tauschii subsp. strangulata]
MASGGRERWAPVPERRPALSGYTGLVGGYQNLGVLHLGRDASVAAVDVLANRPLADAAKTAIALMAVTISEASRLTPISGSIAKHWVPGVLIGDQAVLVVNWKVISCALMVSYQHDQNWLGKEADDVAKPPVNF